MLESIEIAKMQETLIKKAREYGKTFQKYNRESRKGQEWCARTCFHAKEYNVETVGADHVKFAIYEAIEGNMKNRCNALIRRTRVFIKYKGGLSFLPIIKIFIE